MTFNIPCLAYECNLSNSTMVIIDLCLAGILAGIIYLTYPRINKLTQK